MVDCYRVDDFEVKTETVNGAVDVAVKTRTLGARKTNIRKVLGMLAERVEPPFWLGLRWPDHGARYNLVGAKRQEVERLFEAQRAPVVTSITDADLSVSLDFYSEPSVGGESLAPTSMGDLIKRAKYDNSNAAQHQAVKAGVDFVGRHPLLEHAQSVAVVPSSMLGPAPSDSLAMELGAAVAVAFGMHRVALERVAEPKVKQKNLPDGADRADRKANQHNTMVVQEAGDGRVLVIDDVMGYGDSMNEAVRALRLAGFGEVLTLCLAKNLSGTTRYAFDAE